MSTNVKPPVAANLRTLKERRGVTWQTIAQSLEVGERLVNAWASEEDNDPSWFNVCRLALFFEVEPCVFYLPPSYLRALLDGSIFGSDALVTVPSGRQLEQVAAAATA